MVTHIREKLEAYDGVAIEKAWLGGLWWQRITRHIVIIATHGHINMIHEFQWNVFTLNLRFMRTNIAR